MFTVFRVAEGRHQSVQLMALVVGELMMTIERPDVTPGVATSFPCMLGPSSTPLELC